MVWAGATPKVTSVEALATHLLAARKVRIEYGATGTAVLSAPAAAISGLTLQLPSAGARLFINGKRAEGAMRPDGIRWLDIGAQQSTTLRVTGAEGRPVAWTAAARIVLERP